MWRPIKTAPKDGRLILLYRPRATTHTIVVGRWAVYAGTGSLQPCWRFLGMPPYSVDEGITHWQPLPAPPSPAKG